MGDLAYNEIFNNGSSKNQHLAFSLKQYSEALVACEREREKEDPSTKSYSNNWKKKIMLNCLGEQTNNFYYRQESSCINIKDLLIRTICNYSLKALYFSIHLPETNNLLKLLNNKKYDNVKVQFVSKKCNFTCIGDVSYNSKFCKYLIVSIPLELASRYLQKPEKWTCRIQFMNYFYEFNLTGNLPASWC